MYSQTRSSHFLIEKWYSRELSLPKRLEKDELQRKFHGQISPGEEKVLHGMAIPLRKCSKSLQNLG